MFCSLLMVLVHHLVLAETVMHVKWLEPCFFMYLETQKCCQIFFSAELSEPSIETELCGIFVQSFFFRMD